MKAPIRRVGWMAGAVMVAAALAAWPAAPAAAGPEASGSAQLASAPEASESAQFAAAPAPSPTTQFAAAPARARSTRPARRKAAAPRPTPPAPAIYALADLNGAQAAQLDRRKTIVLAPMAVVAWHGFHLPCGTDLIVTDSLTARTARRLRAALPEFAILVLPTLPVGSGPANEMGRIFVHPATLSVSPDAMEKLALDWLHNVAENAYWRAFVITSHPDPEFLRRLSEVCDYYTNVYNVWTVNVTSLVLADSSFKARAAALGEKEAGPGLSPEPAFELMGGAAETSIMLAVRPDAVDPVYRTLDDIRLTSYAEEAAAAGKLGWLGYFGAPRKASAALGRDFLDLWADASADLVVDVVRGEKPVTRPRLEAALKKEFDLREAVRAGREYYDQAGRMFDAWLKQQAPPKPEPAPTGPGAPK